MAPPHLEDIDKTYAKDEAYWSTYIKGRPQIPDTLFQRVAKYHREHHGEFGTVHDVGAGVGVYSDRLAPYFNHVVISDVASSNVDIARDRLGTSGKYSYKTMSVNDANIVPESSVDMVFAANIFHYADMSLAFSAIYKQLKPGGTFTIVGYGHGVLKDPELDAIWRRIWLKGMRVVCRHAKDRKARLRTLWQSATFRGYDTVPLSQEFFEPGSERVILNCEGTWPQMQPDDLVKEFEEHFGLESAVGPNDKIVADDEAEWTFKVDMKGLREQFEACPFASLDPAAFQKDLQELESLMKDGREVEGVWPAAVLLATRRQETDGRGITR